MSDFTIGTLWKEEIKNTNKSKQLKISDLSDLGFGSCGP